MNQTENLPGGDPLSAGPASVIIQGNPGGEVFSTYGIATANPIVEPSGTVGADYPRGGENQTKTDPGSAGDDVGVDGTAGISSIISDFDCGTFTTGNPQTSGDQVYAGAAPGGASRYTGEMELFWMNTVDHKMYTKWKSSDTGGSWAGWTWPSATGTLYGYNPLSAAAMNANTIYVFCNTESGILYYTYYSDSVWHDWARPNGVNNAILAGTGPSAVKVRDGTIDVYFIGTDHHLKVLELGSDGQWSNAGWATEIGGWWNSTPAAVAPSPTIVTVWGKDSGGYLSAISWTSAVGWGVQNSYSAWSKPGGAPAAISRFTDGVDLFYKRASDGKLVARSYYKVPAGSVETSLDSGDSGFSLSSDLDPVAVSWSEYQFSIFTRSTDPRFIGGSELPAWDVIQFNFINKLPHISTTTPFFIEPDQSQQITVTGEGNRFFPDSKLRINDNDVTTTFVNPTTLTATFTMSIPGPATVTVVNPSDGFGGGGTSDNQDGIFVLPPVPSITSLSPPSATAGSGPFTLVVNGAGFVTNSKVRWNGVDKPTTFTSSNQLRASITNTDIATAGTASVTVRTPYLSSARESTPKMFSVTPRSASDKVGVYLNNAWYLDTDGDGLFDAGDQKCGFGSSGWTPVVGNWDGDGASEIGVYQNGVWYLDMDGDGLFDAGDQKCGFGSSGWTPVVGNWDGDGASEIGVYQNGVWYLDRDNDGLFDAGDLKCGFGSSGWSPVIGDWDGDGASEIGVYQNGVWYLDMDGDGLFDAGDLKCGFGSSGWAPVVGDWDVDGATEVGVYLNGVWYLDMDGDGLFDAGDLKCGFGSSGWAPVVGDWDNDRATEIGIYLNGVWYLDRDNDGLFDTGDFYYQFGSSGWAPVVGRWNTPS